MKSSNQNINIDESKSFQITQKGSLGLLAYGDIGLREWRKVKQEFLKKGSEWKSQKCYSPNSTAEPSGALLRGIFILWPGALVYISFIASLFFR